MTELRALIFDVDGTMAETEELHRRAFNEAFAASDLDWSWDVELYRRLLRVTGGKERISHFLSLQRDRRDALSAGQIAELHRVKTARYAELMGDGKCPLRNGILAIIEAAARCGTCLAIATTTSRANIEALLTPTLGQDWARLFTSIASGDDVERKKPAPDVYFKVLEEIGIPAHACLAFEDSRNGLLAANSAGVPVVIVRSLYFSDEEFEGALEIVDELPKLDLYAHLTAVK